MTPELGGTGLVFYGDIVFSGVFRQLTISGGGLLLDGGNYEVPATSIRIDSNRVSGRYWELELSDGFELRERAGDYIVRRVG
jgi:hypothetical protein